MGKGKRLIDANAFLDESLKRYTERERGRDLLYTACEVKQNLADMICEAPTVDAVEVVRCKDCKHMKIDRNGHRWCLVWTGINGMGDDGFCNYGERKDND